MEWSVVWNSALTIVLALMGMVMRSRDSEIAVLREDRKRDREEVDPRRHVAAKKG